MAFAERKDVGTRLGIEKALYPDEAISRSQIQPGRNITFEYKSNRDIFIHGLASKAAGGDLNLKLFYIEVYLQYYFENNFVRHIACTFNGADGAPINVASDFNDGDSDAFSIADGESDDYLKVNYAKYGTIYYIDLYHNFNLTNTEKFLYSIIDISPFSASTYNPSVLNIPKMIGIGNNQARLWGRMPGEVNSNSWVGSNNTKFASYDVPVSFVQHYSGNVMNRAYAITMLAGE